MLCQTSKIIAMRIFIFILFLLVLLGCSQSDDYIGTYVRKHKYGSETVIIYSNHSFLQIYVDGNNLDSNKGIWRQLTKNILEPDLLVFDGWMAFKSPFQSEKAKKALGEGEKSIASFYIRNNCIIAEEDFPEFNPCKK